MILMESVQAHVAAHLSDHLALLDRLVRHPSVAAQGRGLEETAGAVRDLFDAAGVRAEIVRQPGAAPAVLAEFPGRSDRTLLFYDHYDVQPAEPLNEWTVPPFEVTVRNGRISAGERATTRATWSVGWRRCRRCARRPAGCRAACSASSKVKRKSERARPQA